MQKPIAIIGAGNGGQAFAGYLSLHGREVKIFDVVQATVDRLTELGGVTLSGNSDVTGFGKIQLASTDIGAVMEGCEIILVVLPSIYHKDMAEKNGTLSEGWTDCRSESQCFSRTSRI